MRLDWILHPAISYALIAAGMGLCLFLFASLKRDLRAAETRCQKKLAALELDWKAKMDAFDERWKELSQAAGTLVPPAPTRSGLNVNKRSQALQMSRRGEKPQDIAAALSIPQNEVELMLKVQRIVLSGLETTPASSAAAGL
jgi:hypothetical protein